MSKHKLSIDNSQVPEGYKETEVGVIPEDWEVKQLGDILHLKNGFAFRSEYFSLSGPIVLTPGNFRLDGGLYFNDKNTKRYSGKFPELMIFQKGDLLVVMTDLTPDCNLLGKPAFVNSEEIILHNQRIGKINLLSENINKNFLYCILLSSRYLQKIKKQATGSTVRHTSNKSIYSIYVPIPPLPEQRAIAQTLSEVDALIAALDKLIAKKRNIKTATMQELLTGKKRLPGFGEGKGYKNTEVGMIPEDWDVASLVDVSINGGLVRGPFGGALKKEFFVKSGYKVYEQRNAIYRSIEIGNYFIDSKKFNDLRRFEIREGDLIVSCSGTIGCIYQIPEGAPQGVINQALLKITLNNNLIASQFFLAVFCCDKFQEKITENSHGGAMQNLVGMDTFKNTLLQLPSFLEQKAIASILSDMDAEIAVLEKRLAKTKAMKQGMMQELLTGKTRLVVPNKI